MALFNKTKEQIKYTFDKSKVINDIAKTLNDEFKAYKIIYPHDDLWDLLIIRMVSKSVIVKLGSLGLHESVREEIYQEVFAINVLEPDQEIQNDMIQSCSGWTKKHFIVSDAKALRRQLIDMKD